jgi:hypothetical protein
MLKHQQSGVRAAMAFQDRVYNLAGFILAARDIFEDAQA